MPPYLLPWRFVSMDPIAIDKTCVDLQKGKTRSVRVWRLGCNTIREQKHAVMNYLC